MNTLNEPLRGILVGCGFMGGMHAQIYAQLADVELAAVVDLNPERTVEKLKSFGLSAPVFPSLQEALENSDADFVDICMPTHKHLDHALQAIHAGKALFCEKPLALSLEEADQIIQAAEEKGTYAQVGHCIRFWPEYQALAEYHRSGQGGKLLSLNLVRRSARPAYGSSNWLNNPDLSGGAALDLHIHDTDFALSLLGEPQSFTSRVTEDYSGPVHVFTTMDYENLIVTTEGGWNYPEKWGFQMAFQAIYEQAVLDYDSRNEKGLTICQGDEEPRPAEVSKPDSGNSVSGEGNVSELGGYYNELRYFTDCLKEERPPAIATLQEARDSLSLTLKEISSASAAPVL